MAKILTGEWKDFNDGAWHNGTITLTGTVNKNDSYS